MAHPLPNPAPGGCGTHGIDPLDEDDEDDELDDDELDDDEELEQQEHPLLDGPAS
jgi:hypothetical protein